MSENQSDFLGSITKPIILRTFLAITIISALFFVGVNFYVNTGIAAKVNGGSISLEDFDKNVAGEQKYRSEQQKVNYSGTDGEKKLKDLKNEILDKMIEDEIALQELKKLGGEITNQDIDKEFSDQAKSNGGEAKLEELISKYYGFSREEFKKYNIKPKLVDQELQEKVQDSDEINKKPKQTAEDILKRLKAGEDFTKLAKKLSEDKISAENGGDIGWVSKGNQVKEYEDVIFSTNVGEISNVFKTYQGYNIIKVLEKKDDKVHISQIIIRTVSFNEWLDSKVNSANVKKYVKI